MVTGLGAMGASGDEAANESGVLFMKFTGCTPSTTIGFVRFTISVAI